MTLEFENSLKALPNTIELTTISGRVMSKSDVQTIPDSPINGWVIALSRVNFDEITRDTGFTDTEKNNDFLLRSSFDISEEQFQKFVAANTISSAQGAFELSLTQGDYLLCLANLFTVNPPGTFPANIIGCIELHVQERKKVKQNIFWGEAGVTSQ